MFSYLEERTPAEVEAIRRTIQELLRQTCILQVKYDPVTLTARDNARYQVCLKHREFIADYLSVIGCELVHDPLRSRDSIKKIACSATAPALQP